MPQKKRMPNGKQGRNWYMDFIIDGKRVNRSCGTPDFEEAVWVEQQARSILEEALVAEMDVNMATEPEHMTLQDALDFTKKEKWSRNKDGCKPIAQVTRCIELLGNPSLADMMDNPRATRPTGVRLFRELRNTLANECDLGDATIDRYMAAMKTCLKFVRAEKPLPTLQIPKIPMANPNNGRERILFEDEEQMLFELMEAQQPEWADFFKVLLDTGMRVGECLSLDFRRNVRFKENQISIYKDQTKGTRQTGKGRSIIMTKRVREILLRIQETRPMAVWPTTWYVTKVSKIFRRYRKMMGLDTNLEFVPHMLRHTCTTRLLEAGIDFGVVQAWTGHSTVEMVRRYGHFTAQIHVKSATALDDLHDKIYGK